MVDGIDRILHAGSTGEEHTRRPRNGPPHPIEQIQTALVRESKVGEDDIEGLPREEEARRSGGGNGNQLEVEPQLVGQNGQH
jgi:hypothetical protein